MVDERLHCVQEERADALICHPVKDCDECRRCGWEKHEAERRRRQLRTEGIKRDGQTWRYCLHIRREPEQ